MDAKPRQPKGRAATCVSVFFTGDSTAKSKSNAAARRTSSAEWHDAPAHKKIRTRLAFRQTPRT